MTYNVAGCVGRQDRFNSERILRVIEEADADVMALQEVYDPRGGGEFLAKLREMGFATIHFGPAVRDQEGHYGNALMIREGDGLVDELDLSVSRKEPRSAIRANFSRGDWEIEVIATHLGLSPTERSEQIHRLSDWLGDSDQRMKVRFVLGDLNEWRWFSSCEKLIARHFGVGERLRTFPSWFPIFGLDRILVSGDAEMAQFRWWRLNGPSVRAASDHLPLLMEWCGE